MAGPDDVDEIIAEIEQMPDDDDKQSDIDELKGANE